MIKLITTNSYFNVFSLLVKELKGKANTLSGKNLVFSEEKVSLMAERYISNAFKGSFNTDVYSFGNFLRKNKPMDNVLSKEGSAMVIRRILKEITLSCFKVNKENLAPCLYELIAQLKSARVSVENLLGAVEKTEGFLKGKLKDIVAVYSAYEKYLSENNLIDQSLALSFLPDVIENMPELKDTDVYIIGYTGFTMEMRKCVSTLIKNCKSVTAILPEGENAYAFVNESAEIFKNICDELGKECIKENIKSEYTPIGERIVNGLFSAKKYKEKEREGKVYFNAYKNPAKEIEAIASAIKKGVMEGQRYKDYTVIVPDINLYRNSIKREFSLLEIPYFLDEKKSSIINPLTELIKSYLNIFKFGLNRETFSEFIKNPLVIINKDLSDGVINYLIKYNIDYDRIKNNFLLPAKDEKELNEFETARSFCVSLLQKFSVRDLLDKLSISEKLKESSSRLKALGAVEESAINEQIYDSVLSILNEMDKILGDKIISKEEFSKIFESGISALELSIIPQYNDAVFIGGFKEAALSRAKNLFVIGLTSSIPSVKEDVALLSDRDIDVLMDVKVLVEPKIKIVNHRTREETALGISAFTNNLYLSYPIADFSGNKNEKSEILSFVQNAFILEPLSKTDSVLTKNQSIKTFAIDCGKFYDGKISDFTVGASIKEATENTELNRIKKIEKYSNRIAKTSLNENARVLLKDVTNPTAIEDFYSCPYRFFINHALKVKSRETGKVDSLKTGNLMHDIFKEFVSSIGKVKDETFEKIFNECKEKVLSLKQYSGIYSDDESYCTMELLIKECKKYCEKLYKWDKRSKFKTSKTEVSFGKERDGLLPILLDGGNVKLSGKIDRVDEYEDYIRVIDYKTGKASDADKDLFSGTKMQLYLYAKVFNGKTLAGAYYLPVNDSYQMTDKSEKETLVIGKTLNDESVIKAQDELWEEGGIIPVEKKVLKNSEKINNAVDSDTLNAFVEYAYKMSEKCVENLKKGVIVATPKLNGKESTCDYCEYRSMCGDKIVGRKIKKVSDSVIVDAIKGD